MTSHLLLFPVASPKASTGSDLGRGQRETLGLSFGATYVALASCLPWHLRTCATCHMLTYLRVLQPLDGKKVLVRAAALDEYLDVQSKFFTLILQEEQLEQGRLLSQIPSAPLTALQRCKELQAYLREQAGSLRLRREIPPKFLLTRWALRHKAQRQGERREWQDFRLKWTLTHFLLD
jgi:hypothetical protein